LQPGEIINEATNTDVGVVPTSTQDEIDAATIANAVKFYATIRHMWRTSPEQRRFIAQFRRYVVTTFPLVVAAGVFFSYLISPTPRRVTVETGSVGAIVGAFGWIWFSVPAYLGARRRSIDALRDRITLGVAEQELRAADSEVSEGAIDLGSVWAETQRRLDYYHKIATSQAERSFFHVQLAAGAGFFILAASIVAASIAREFAVAVPIALIGAGGGALSAFLGSTFMRSQENSAAQLREYFNQPLEFSRILAAERLIESLPEAERSPAVISVLAALSTSLSGPSQTITQNSRQSAQDEPRLARSRGRRR
jgi:hypothetical protein